MKKRVKDLEFTLLRSKRRTADIVVERDGQVVVRAPDHIADEAIESAVDRRAAWVHRTLAEWGDLNASRSLRPMVQGSSFPYLGRNYRLRISAKADRPLSLTNGRWELSQDTLARHGEAAARKAFRDFYINKGAPLLTERAEHFAPKVGVEPGPLTVKELGYHWASCGSQGALNFHWKVLMAPRTVVDYIVVHELCHLRHRDHSNAFWNEVDKVLPRYAERKEWLRRNGASFDLLDHLE
jgi:predicted metal-dependent hydrolase